jgi:ATP-dependent helicase HrpB
VRNCELLVAGEIREVESRKNERRVTLSLCTEVKEWWLKEMFPEDFSEEDAVTFDASGKRIVGVRRRKFRDLVLEEKTSANVPPEQAAAMLAEGIIDGRFHLKHWNHEVDQWIFRVNGLSRWCPELEFPRFGNADRKFILEQLCFGNVSAKEIRDKPVKPVLREWLSRGHRTALDEYAPERIPLPSGRKVRVIYSETDAPTISSRIQDLYGVNRPITIAMGKQRLRIQILAPNQRPVQVTDDPAGFWRDTYPAVKKELRKKYPKHEWK